MTDSTYKGDSPNKKISRSFAWTFVLDMMKALDIEPKGAVVLAGEGGDLSVLSGAAPAYGLDPGELLYNTTAIDWDLDCVRSCVNKYQCSGRVGEASEIIPTLDGYNLTHMDFCNGITVDNLSTVVTAIANAQMPSFHLVTLMRGREPDTSEHNLCDLMFGNEFMPRYLRRKMQLHLRKDFGRDYPPAQLLARGVFDVRGALAWTVKDLRKYLDSPRGEHENYSDYFTDKGKLTSYGTGMVRVNLFTDCLAVLRPDIAIHRLFTNSYQSQTKTSRGTPFVTFGFLALPTATGFLDQMVTKYVRHIAGEHPLSGWNAKLYHGAEAGHKELIKTAMLYSRNFGNKTAAKLLNVSPGTIAAWKAHKTMGTYSNNQAKRKASNS